MFTPNRIGEHFLCEVAADRIGNLWGADASAITGNALVHQVQTRSGTLNDPVSTDVYVQSNNVLISAGENISYGRFIDGTHSYEEGDQQYLVCGALSARFDNSAPGVNIKPYIGRLDTAGPVATNFTGVINPITHGIPLPCNGSDNGSTIERDFALCVIDGKYSTAVPFQTNPIAAYWNMHYDSGADLNLLYLRLSIGIYNYKKPLDRFDPLRG